MKPRKSLITIFACLSFCLIPQMALSTEVIGNWVAEPWQPEDMITWGADNVLVDFGSNGLWRYNGSWIRISHWNPKRMITWSESKLMVDFGQNGLYCYDGKAWKKIAIPKQ